MADGLAKEAATNSEIKECYVRITLNFLCDKPSFTSIQKYGFHILYLLEMQNEAELDIGLSVTYRYISCDPGHVFSP